MARVKVLESVHRALNRRDFHHSGSFTRCSASAQPSTATQYASRISCLARPSPVGNLISATYSTFSSATFFCLPYRSVTWDGLATIVEDRYVIASLAGPRPHHGHIWFGFPSSGHTTVLLIAAIGLLPLLKSIQKPCNLRKFAGQTIGVDAYGWLHRGTVACALALALDKPTTKYFYPSLVLT